MLGRFGGIMRAKSVGAAFMSPLTFAVARQIFWLNHGLGKTVSGADVSQWLDQVAGLVFDDTTGDAGAIALVRPLNAGLIANGRQALDFAGNPSRGLSSAEAALDNIWDGNGKVALFFAFRPSQMPTGGEAAVLSKNRTSGLGWSLTIKPAGELVLSQETSSTTSWFAGVSLLGSAPVVEVSKPCLGFVVWDGVTTSVAGVEFTIWDGVAKAWVQPAMFTGASAIARPSDAATELYLTRDHNTTDTTFLRHFHGSVWSLGALRQFDRQNGPTGPNILQSYLQQFTNEPDNVPFEFTANLYGSKLKLNLDAANDVIHVSNVVSRWDDQVAFRQFLVPTSTPASVSPALAETSQNARPALDFALANRRLQNDAAQLDNLWAGSGTKAIHFAARIDSVATADSVLVEKGFLGTGTNKQGWRLEVRFSDGALRFRHEDTADGRYDVVIAAGYVSGDLVMGSISWDGVMTTGAGVAVRLYDNATGQFRAYTPSVTLAGATRGSDSDFPLTIGNNVDQTSNASSFDSRFRGVVMGVWFTNPADISLDDSIMSKWIAP